MGIFEWEPFLSSQKRQHGLLGDLSIAALEKKGYSVVIESYPFARIMEYLKTGKIDFAPAISVTEERKTFLNFSSSIHETEQGFTFKKGTIPYITIKDLKPYTGGILRGSFWQQELEATGIHYEEVKGQEQNIKKLMANRVDFVCMPKEIALYLIKELKDDPGQYEFCPLRTEEQTAGISKKTSFPELLEDFNHGLALIKQDGTYDRILSSYQLD